MRYRDYLFLEYYKNQPLEEKLKALYSIIKGKDTYKYAGESKYCTNYKIDWLYENILEDVKNYSNTPEALNFIKRTPKSKKFDLLGGELKQITTYELGNIITRDLEIYPDFYGLYLTSSGNCPSVGNKYMAFIILADTSVITKDISAVKTAYVGRDGTKRYFISDHMKDYLKKYGGNGSHRCKSCIKEALDINIKSIGSIYIDNVVKFVYGKDKVIRWSITGELPNHNYIISVSINPE